MLQNIAGAGLLDVFEKPLFNPFICYELVLYPCLHSFPVSPYLLFSRARLHHRRSLEILCLIGQFGQTIQHWHLDGIRSVISIKSTISN